MRRNRLSTVTIAGLALAVILGAAGGFLLWGSAYVHNSVQDQLTAQKVYFPPRAAFGHARAGTEITPSMIPGVSQYAGQQLVTGQQAEAYANDFIAVHLQEMAPGQTYATLSAKSLAQPKNTALAGLVLTVFRGQTLRGLLLNAYGWWKVSQIMYIAAICALALAGLTLAGTGTTAARRRRTTPATRVTPQPTRPQKVTVA